MVLAAGPFGLGPLELVVILVVVVMLFGATRLADIGGSLGKGIREFKKNVKEDEAEAAAAEAPTVTATTAPANGAETVSAVKCSNCGTLNAAGARFCSNCGTTIATPVS